MNVAISDLRRQPAFLTQFLAASGGGGGRIADFRRITSPGVSSAVLALGGGGGVEPKYRMQEIGSALVGRAVSDAFALHFRRLYLCAGKERRRFFIRQGWQPIEEDAGSEK